MFNEIDNDGIEHPLVAVVQVKLSLALGQSGNQ